MLTILNVEHFPGNIYLNISAMGLSEFFSYIISGFISINFTRVHIYKCVFYSGTFVLIGLFALISLNKNDFYVQLGSLLSLFIFRFLVSSGGSIFNTYVSELYPTSIRHYAFGLLVFCINFSSIFVPSYI